MVPSIGSSLLAATMFLGQATDVQVIQQPGGKTVIYSSSSSSTQTQQTQQQQTSSRPFLSWWQDRPVLTKLQSWFGGGKKDPQEPQQMQPSYPPRGTVLESKQPTYTPGFGPAAPATQPQDFPKKMPSPSSQSPLSQNPPRSTAMPSSPYSVQTANSKPVQQTAVQMPGNQAALTMANVKYPISPQFANKIGRDEKFEWITGQLEVENNVHVLYYATPDTIDIYHGRIVLHPQQVNMTQFRRGDLISVRGNVVQTSATTPVYRLTDANVIERAK